MQPVLHHESSTPSHAKLDERVLGLHDPSVKFSGVVAAVMMINVVIRSAYPAITGLLSIYKIRIVRNQIKLFFIKSMTAFCIFFLEQMETFYLNDSNLQVRSLHVFIKITRG